MENFWETGYGMPSFTLLGPRVIRFPFILHSSYPHEILHNWWGNGVYVDWQPGNWCEGLTAYLADHLIREERGQGAEYRQTTLQKYADYVSADGERDFPLMEFRSRHSSATEAVGYGKSLMFFHMLRRELGDEVFVAGLRRFYADNVVRGGDLRRHPAGLRGGVGARPERALRAVGRRLGAPRAGGRSHEIRPGGTGWQLSFSVHQTQAGEPYRLTVPVAVTTATGAVRQESLLLDREAADSAPDPRRAAGAGGRGPGVRPVPAARPPGDPAGAERRVRRRGGSPWCFRRRPGRNCCAAYRELAEGWGRSRAGTVDGGGGRRP